MTTKASKINEYAQGYQDALREVRNLMINEGSAKAREYVDNNLHMVKGIDYCGDGLHAPGCDCAAEEALDEYIRGCPDA